jgi:hypothetical protein
VRNAVPSGALACTVPMVRMTPPGVDGEAGSGTNLGKNCAASGRVVPYPAVPPRPRPAAGGVIVAGEGPGAGPAPAGGARG